MKNKRFAFVLSYLKKKLELAEQSLEKQQENNEQMSAQNVRLQSELSAAVQTLEREQNLKIKSEIDNNYVKSLRFSVSFMLRTVLFFFILFKIRNPFLSM